MWKIPSTSTEYLGPIRITGATASDPVEIAVIARGLEEPAETDWHPASAWDGTNAQLLIGPGTSLTLLDGMYKVFTRITASPEKPVIEVENGLLRIT